MESLNNIWRDMLLWMHGVDEETWMIVIVILSIIVGLLLVYLIRIHIAYRMAVNRHRDPVGWVLLSFFFSPFWTWIILLCIGDNTLSEIQHENKQADE